MKPSDLLRAGAAILALGLAAAQAAPGDPLYRAVEDYLRAQNQGIPGKVEYHITPLEARARLGKCDAFEPFQPPGAAPWGRTTVGVR
ncbi:MAG: flagellar basal body P-ring formation protein FlgA, partial [Candidatus Accumulibacter sp.]|nr:flagellar basal body P-ring formation protein FlgA [Accumulibacter sp.]